MQKNLSKVFVSYSRHDEELVKPLAGLLGTTADAVFIDIESLKPGDLWRDSIEAAVRDATVFILCWCCESRQSDFVAHEIAIALEDGSKRLVPVLFCSTPLPKPLSERQWIDLRGRIIHACNGSEHPIRTKSIDDVSKRLPTIGSLLKGAVMRVGLSWLGILTTAVLTVGFAVITIKFSVQRAMEVMAALIAFYSVSRLFLYADRDVLYSRIPPAAYSHSEGDEVAQIAIKYFENLGK